MRVGVAGFGKMGSALATRLQSRGHAVLAWNRTPGRITLRGVHAVEAPVELARHADVIISSLFDDTAALDVYAGADGLLNAASGKLFIEMSTLQPATQRALGLATKAAGGAFVECPVGGSTGPANEGQLIGLAGGDTVDFQRALPLLGDLCRRVHYLGPVGAASAAKLALNLPLLVFWQALGEALLLLDPHATDVFAFLEAFNESAGAPAVLKGKWETVLSSLRGQTGTSATFDVGTMRKDMELILAERPDLPVAAAALAALQDACLQGAGHLDCAQLPAYRLSITDVLKH
jgi:3-hydroxyisobutyrate dehydrogenase